MSTAPAQRHGPIRWISAIADALLDKREKSVLYAYLRFLDWDTGVAFPSIDRLASGSGLGRRAVQLGCRELRKRGVLVDLRAATGGIGPHGYGYTNQVRLDITALETLKGAAAASLGRTGAPQRAHRQTPKGARGAHNQTIHTKPTQQTHHPRQTQGEMVGSLRGVWMDGHAAPEPPGTDLRALLRSYGIAGPNLELLLGAPGLSEAEIRREWASITSDPSVCKYAAVLFARLAKRYGVAAFKRRGPLDKDLRQANDHLLRRRYGRGTTG